MTLSWDKEIKLIWLNSMITLLGLMALVAYVEVKENEKIQCGIAQKHTTQESAQKAADMLNMGEVIL